MGGIIYFGSNVALAALGAFLPTIIQTFGVCEFPELSIRGDCLHRWAANAQAQLLTVPPYAVAAVVLIVTSVWSDRVQSRGLHITGSCLLSAVGYL